MEKAEKEKGGGGRAVGGEEPNPDKEADKGKKSPQSKRYGEAVKRLVVEQIEAGKLTAAQAQRLHGIAGAQTIRGWQAKYGKEGGGVRRASALAAAQAQIEKLKGEKAELERALGRLTVRNVVLECTLEVAEEKFGEDFKKKRGPMLSSSRDSGFGRKG